MNVTYASKAFLTLTVAVFLFGCDSVTSLFKADPGKQASVIVQQQLNSPASFNYVDSEVLWKGKSKTGEPAYVVSVSYDAQNGFGATLRGCMLVSYHETSDSQMSWDRNYGVREADPQFCKSSTPIGLKVEYATALAKANSFVAQNAASPAPATSTPAKPAVAPSAAPSQAAPVIPSQAPIAMPSNQLQIPDARLLETILSIVSVPASAMQTNNDWTQLEKLFPTAQWANYSDKTFSDGRGAIFKSANSMLTIRVLGARTMILRVDADRQERTGELLFSSFFDGNASTKKLCAVNESASFGETYYQISIANYKPVVVKYSWSAGSGGSTEGISAGDVQMPKSCEVSSTSFAPSFDCSKASNGAERLICTDRDLSKLDVELSQRYMKAREAVQDKEKLKSEQIAWLKSSRNACSDKNCMSNALKQRISELSK